MKNDKRKPKLYVEDLEKAKKAIEMHDKGYNTYNIAQELFEYASDEAYDRVYNTIMKAIEFDGLLKAKSKNNKSKNSENKG